MYFPSLMMRHAILAAYPGPITLYYGDEYGDDTRDATGAQPDNIARTSGHLQPRDAGERRLHDYVAALMKVRSEYPAMWRGNSLYTETDDLLTVTRTDPATGQTLMLLFPLADTTLKVPPQTSDLLGFSRIADNSIHLKALIPAIIAVK